MGREKRMTHPGVIHDQCPSMSTPHRDFQRTSEFAEGVTEIQVRICFESKVFRKPRVESSMNVVWG
jgi:hypothetical protein